MDSMRSRPRTIFNLLKRYPFSITVCFLLSLGVTQVNAQQNTINGATFSEYGNAVHREVAQSILLNNYRVTGSIFISEVVNSNNSNTLSIFVNNKQRFAYSYVPYRIHQFLSPGEVAVAVIQQLERDKKIIRKRQLDASLR